MVAEARAKASPPTRPSAMVIRFPTVRVRPPATARNAMLRAQSVSMIVSFQVCTVEINVGWPASRDCASRAANRCAAMPRVASTAMPPTALVTLAMPSLRSLREIARIPVANRNLQRVTGKVRPFSADPQVSSIAQERGHRVPQVRGKGDKVAVVPLPPAVSRAIDTAVGERVRPRTGARPRRDCDRWPVPVRRDGRSLWEAYMAEAAGSYASPSGLATTTVYPSGSRSQISRWPGPLPWPLGAVRWAYHGRVQLCDAGDDAVEVGHVTEPQQYAVPDRAVRVSHGTVMVLGPDVVQLQDEVPVGEQPLVLGAAVVAAQAEQLLVPTAGGFHVAYRDHGLGPGGTGQDDDSDPVAGRVVDLDEPAFPVVESGAAAYGAAVGDYLAERGLQLVGADPQDRAAGGGRLEVGGQLADHCGCLEAAVPQSDRPAEHRLVERRGPGYVECGELQVSDLAVRRRLDPAVDVGSSHGDLLLLAERGLDGGVSATSSRRAVRANQSWYRSTDQRRWRTSRSNTAGSISSHMVSTASCRVSSSCRSALPARPSTIHPAVIARCRIICSVSSASYGG